MARKRVHAVFEPNVSEVKTLQTSKNITIKIQKPKMLSDIIVEIYEVEQWLTGNQKRQADQHNRRNDLLATFKGNIRGGKFVVTSSDISEVQPSDNLFFPPAVPIVFEGSPKRYKLVIAKQNLEYEGYNWELGLKIKKRNQVLFKSKHATIIKGASQVYLNNRGLGDSRADIYKAGNPHKEYIRQLKHHLTIMGFYRRENEKYNGNRRYKVRTKTGKTLASYRYLHVDKWDDELEKAIDTFQVAATQRWRFHVGQNKFIQIPSNEVWDKNDLKNKNEIDNLKVGDRTKEEIIKWLGPNYDAAMRMPIWRNPYLYSFKYAYDQFYKTGYKGKDEKGANGYDKESGRLIARPRLNRRKFVCTTAVNWLTSHLLAIGKDYSYSANAPIIHAAVGGKIYAKQSRKTYNATPLYYKDYFKPTHFLPWIHPLDPDKEKLTLEILKELSKPRREPYSRRSFMISREAAEIGVSRNVIWTRYLIPRRYRTLIQFQIIRNSTTAWAPRPWIFNNSNITIKRLVKDKTKKKMKLELEESVPANHELLVSYKAYDSVCNLPTGRHAWDEPNLTCKCGLHKSYAEIISDITKLGTWNIAGMHNGWYSFDHSTLVIHRTNGNLYVLHGDGRHYFRTFEKEVQLWNNIVGKKGMYYTIFKVDDDAVKSKNPCFHWNQEAWFNFRDYKYDYAPMPE